MSKLSCDILEKIKNDKVKPKSYWYFLFLHAGVWTAFIATLLVSSLGISVAVRHILAIDWELAKHVSPNPLKFMPVFWLLIIVLAIVAADWAFKKTQRGYRFKISHVILASVAISLTLGSGFFAVNADQVVEDKLTQKVSHYRNWKKRHAIKFIAPHRGVLAGEITHVDLNEEWRLVDFNGTLWVVDITKAKIAPDVDKAIGSRVGMRGELIDDVFIAEKIRSFKAMPKPLKPRR